MHKNSVGNIISQEIMFFGPIPILERALCASNIDITPDAFFPETKKFSDRNRQAKSLCKNCPEMEACLEYALVNDIREGIWGGKTRQDRLDIRRQRRMSKAYG